MENISRVNEREDKKSVIASSCTWRIENILITGTSKKSRSEAPASACRRRSRLIATKVAEKISLKCCMISSVRICHCRYFLVISYGFYDYHKKRGSVHYPFFCILKIMTKNYISVQLLKSAEPSAVVGALGRDAAVPSIQKIF